MSDVTPGTFLSCPFFPVAQGSAGAWRRWSLKGGNGQWGLAWSWLLCSHPSLVSSPTTQEICLSDSPVVMTLVDGPAEESDNLICVAYRHQFDVVNESTGEAFRLHHVEANRVSQRLWGQVGIRKD